MAADPKAAPLADDLKELALSLPTSVFPKAFFCALCSELAIDSYKLLCCNKAICATCQSKLSFPTTCPSCDHSPLEADSCAPNKALRNTMRVWLQKQKKKEEAKVAAQTATPALEAKSPATGGPVLTEGADKPLDSVEVAATAGDTSFESAAAPTDAEDGKLRTVSASAQPKEGSAALDGHDAERRAGSVPQTATQSVEPPAVNASSNENNKMDDDTNTTGNNPMMNGMQNQMGFGFQGQSFGGMGFNGMPNMMGNTWNNMNPMDFNMSNMNNMYNNNFGGNMGMAMGDMSAMNMMNYGGGYGNGWNGMGGGYGNFNGFNQMGGYNQSGGYPEMMNQFPKSNFPNQNQNHLPASQGGALPQQNNRAGSHAGSVSGTGGASSRPGSRSGPAQNVRRSHKSLPGQPSLALRNIKPSADDVTPQQREGESPDASADATADSKPEDGQDPVVQSTEEGNDKDDGARESAATANTTADSEVNAEDSTITGNQDQSSGQTNGLNQIQTVGSEDADMQAYGQSMMSNGIVPNMGFANGMMNQFPNQMQMNAPFNPGMSMGFHQNNSFGPRGGFNAAYGAATVLTGEPQGRGVEGAPTGPRAMREGRPNTGFSSRMNNTRYQPPPPPKSMTPAQSVGARSPQRRVRSRSPQRDETLRTRDKSVTRSRSRSQPRDDEKGGRRERSRSADGESRREGRGRSVTPQGDTDLERRNDHRHYRSRDDDREDEYDDRARDDRGSRGDRTRSVSADSKYRSSRRDKEKYRSSRSHRERSNDRRRHRSRSPVEKSRYDDASYANGDRESQSSSRRRHRSDKDKHRDRSRDRSRDKDRERDRRDRREKEKDHDYERDKDRSRNKDKERRRRRDREAEVDDRDYDDDRYRSARRSHKDRDRDERDRDDHSRDDRRESDRDAKTTHAAEDDIVGKMMQKRAISPPLNAPTGPSANTFSIKGAGRTKSSVMPPPQPPTGPRGFQPPKGPAADRDKERHRRKSSASSVVSTPATPSEATSQDHYAAERERNARERNSRDRVDRDQRDVLSKSLHSRIHSASRSSVSAKRSRDEDAEVDEAPRESTRSDIKVPTGPASHRDKRRKSGAGGDNSIANLFTAGLRKNAGKTRRGGVRTEGDVEREMERVERERDRR